MYKEMALHEIIQRWDFFEKIQDKHCSKVMAKVRECFNPTNIAACMVDVGMCHKTLRKLKEFDRCGVFKNMPVHKVIQRMKDFSKEAFEAGLGWGRTDGYTVGYMVNNIEAYLTYMILIYEKRVNHAIGDICYFKLGIDSRVHYGKGGQVCEIFIELLADRGLLSCVSLAKFDGKDARLEVEAHVANRETWPDGGHLFDQLQQLMVHGLKLEDGRHIQIIILECHNLHCIYQLVCDGTVSATSNEFCPWYTITKDTCNIVTTIYTPKPEDTIISIANDHCMTTTILTTFNKTLINIPLDQPFEHIIVTEDLLVMCDWPIDRANNLKLTPSPMEALVYCMRHAIIRTVLKMFRLVQKVAQEADRSHPRGNRNSRLQQLFTKLKQSPFNLGVRLSDYTYKGQKYVDILYGQADGRNADKILENFHQFLPIIEGFPYPNRYELIVKMWDSYRRLNYMQQRYDAWPRDQVPSGDQSIEIVAREYLWYATQVIGNDITPHIHIQGAHAGQIANQLPSDVILGRLKNEVMERKHREMKNIKTAQGA
jgi:hypothetical protein